MPIKRENDVYYCKCGSEMELVGAAFATVCKKCWNVFSFKDGWHNGLEKAKQLTRTIEIDKLHYVQLLSQNQSSTREEEFTCSNCTEKLVYNKTKKTWDCPICTFSFS